MRHILTPVFLLVLLFPSLALGETMDDLVIRKGLHYKKFSDVPFTGKVTGKTQGTFRNGEQHGPWISYHDNGQLSEKGTYKDGLMFGPWVIYNENGMLVLKGTFKDGWSQDGPWVRYYDNGQLNYKGTYKDSRRVGPWVSYNKDGTVDKEYTGTFKNGVKISD